MVKNIPYDQHFCIDEVVLEGVCAAAALNPHDTVLEIGPGTGNLTRIMALQVKKVITIEIDRSLQSKLLDLPRNVEVIYGNALELIPAQRCSKLVANIPYQICEPLLHVLCFKKDLQLMVLLVPKKFATHVSQHPIFSAFLDFEIIQDVPKEAFSPPPKVSSAILRITPTAKKDLNTLIRRKLHLQRDKQVKNAARDTLVDVSKLTKRQAQDLMKNMPVPKKTVAKLTLREFQELALTLQKLAPR